MLHNSEIIRRAYKYLFPGELELLKRIIQSVDRSPCVVVNIGAGSGTSALAILESRPDVILHTVDIQEDNSPFGCLYAERQVCHEAGYRLGEGWYQYHMDSKELAKVWTGPVDVVFVDGDHTYDGCVGDILGWLPHIHPGGYIAVHDYRKDDIPTGADGYHADGPHPLAFEGIDQAVDELLLYEYGAMERVASLIVFRVDR
jgi:predicted O-methyltransferase YrrM